MRLLLSEVADDGLRSELGCLDGGENEADDVLDDLVVGKHGLILEKDGQKIVSLHLALIVTTFAPLDVLVDLRVEPSRILHHLVIVAAHVYPNSKEERERS